MKKITLGLFSFLMASMSFAQDTCATASTLVDGSTVTVAMVDGTAPQGCFQTLGTAGEWYTYTATSDGVIEVSSDLAQNAGGDTRFHIYEGSCGTLTCVGGSDDITSSNFLSTFILQVSAGTTYYVAWDDRWDDGGFDFTFDFRTVSCTSTPPYNEDFSNEDNFVVCIETVDADNGGAAWQYNDINDLDGDGTPDALMAIPADATQVSKDDYVFGAPLNLQANTSYDISFTYNSLLNTAAPTGNENNSARFLVADAPTASANITELGNDPAIVQTGVFGDTNGNDIISQAITTTFTYTTTAAETIHPAFHANTPVNGENMWLLLFEINVSSGTASVETTDADLFTISPNPATDRFLVKTNELIDSVSVYNMLGQNVEVSFNQNSNEVNISDLKSGTYFIKASSNGSSKTMKFVKN